MRVTAVLLGGVLLAIAITLAVIWPFTNKKIVRSLEHFSQSEVRVESFHRIYLPHPGYVADNLTFWRRGDKGAVRLASASKLTCTGSWLAMLTFTDRLKELHIQGLKVMIPSPVPAPIKLYPGLKEQTTITTLVADGAVLEVARRDTAGEPLRFEFPQLILGNIQNNKPIKLRTLVHNPEPRGDLAVQASFGPLNKGNIGLTKLKGSFKLTHADLGQFRIIQGTVASNGTFDGTLGLCRVRGSTAIPNFEVTSSGHAIGLSAEFDTLVDGRNGDVTIQSTNVHLLHSVMQARGKICSQSRHDGKTLSLDVDGNQARIEDLLRMFVKSDVPPVEGPIGFRAKVVLPPGNDQFLRRVRLDGSFRVPEAEFPKRTTQSKVDELSERARGKGSKAVNSERVAAELESQVHVRNAIAVLSQASFQTPGAVVRGEGDYNLLTEQIDMHGKLAMQASLSKAAGGMKSVFLLPLDPFFKKQHAGAVIPIRITGTYSHPIFKVSLTGK